MKKALIYVLSAILFLCSCTKAAKQTSSPYFSVTGSDGSTVNSTGSYLKAGKNESSPYPYLSVKGATPTAPGITFWINTYTATTGTMALDNVNAGVFYSPSAGVTKTLASGSLTIAAVSPNIAGTITFTCTDATVVTGSFDVVAP